MPSNTESRSAASTSPLISREDLAVRILEEAGVVFQDSRVKYVEIQVDAKDWMAFEASWKRPDPFPRYSKTSQKGREPSV